MIYINKNNDAAANAIIDNYLLIASSNHWLTITDIYSKFSCYGKRRLVDTVLLPEQDIRCCYCMKRFNPTRDQDATIEHMIPRSTPNNNSFTDYFHLNYPGLNSINVCHTDDFINSRHTPTQYPHHVAYHNFAVACHDCNNYRGNCEVGFPFLLPKSRQHISYNRITGKIDWFDDPKLFSGAPENEYMVNCVNLNRPFLKAVRAVWLFGKDHPTANYSTPDTVHNDNERYDLIYRTCGAAINADPNFSEQDIDAFIALNTDGEWNELLKYDYFSTI